MLGALCCLTLAAAAAQDAAKSELAARAMLEERFAEAETLYKELLAADPANPGLLLNLGLAEQSQGKLREAVKRFRAAAGLQPDSTMVWLLLGAAHRKLGEPAEAIRPLERALEREPSNHAAALELAEAFFDLERFQEAAPRFYRLAEIEPSNPRAWQALGICYVRMARKTLAELGRTAPDSAYWWALAGRERAESGRIESAYAFYREALARDPSLRGIRTAVAEIYTAAGRGEWAKIEQEREAKLAAPDCSKEPAECELRAGRYWQAVEEASKMSGPRAIYWEALAHYELAQIAFTRLAELPLSAERYERLAEVHRLMGRHKEAAAMWREALALAPQDQRLQKELSRSMADAREDAGTAGLPPRALELARSAKITAP